MRITCISDLHGHLPEIEETTILIIAGDICPATDHHVRSQARWLDTEFRAWLNAVPAKHVVACWGNHDFIGEQATDLIPVGLRWKLLRESSVTVEGLNLWGSAYSLWFYDWAFNAPKRGGEEFLAEKYRWIPSDTHIVISHGPPRGYGDFVSEDVRSPNRGQHVGSTALLEKVKQLKPLLTVFGHIHDGHGVYECLWPEGDSQAFCTVANASILNEHYKPVYPPLQFEVTHKQEDDRSWYQIKTV